MMIPSYARYNFEIKESDDKQTILNKRFFLEMDRVSRQLKLDERLNDFDNRYREIKKMRNKTPIEQLKLEVALHELLNE